MSEDRDELLEIISRHAQAGPGESIAEAIGRLVSDRDQLRGAMAAQDEREKRAGERCGVPRELSGCDWPDAVADTVDQLRIDLAEAQQASDRFFLLLEHRDRECDGYRAERDQLRRDLAEVRVCLRDAARMLAEHRGTKTEGAILLDRIEAALSSAQHASTRASGEQPTGTRALPLDDSKT